MDKTKGVMAMILVHAVVAEDGTLKVKEPELRGEEIVLALPEQDEAAEEKETDWQAVKAVFKKADALDFPRRSPEEILKDLRELREP